MAYEYAGESALDYFPCRYGQSKLLFRGPRRRLEGPYAVALGGSETYGKFVADPYPALLEEMLGLPVVNFGYMNAGADLFVNEPTIVEACSRAKVTVLQMMGAQNMSNRFYAVHPRRNDRFLRASTLMKTIFREIDFTEFHFTRHLLSALRSSSLEKYALVESELKAAWVARTRSLLQKIDSRTVLLWVSGPAQNGHDELGNEPLLIDAGMIDEVRPFASDVVHVTLGPTARHAGTEGMHYAPMEAPAAAAMPGPGVHKEIAAALAPVLRRVIKT